MRDGGDWQPLGVIGLAGRPEVQIPGLAAEPVHEPEPVDVDEAAAMQAWLLLMMRLARVAMALGVDGSTGLTWRRVGTQTLPAVVGAPPRMVATGWALMGGTHEARFDGPRFAREEDAVRALDAAEAELRARLPVG